MKKTVYNKDRTVRARRVGIDRHILIQLKPEAGEFGGNDVEGFAGIKTRFCDNYRTCDICGPQITELKAWAKKALKKVP